MNQLVLINADEKVPILSGEITVLNKLSEKANSLVAGVKKFLHVPFRVAKKETHGKISKIVLQPENKSITANTVPVCSNDFKFKEKFREKYVLKVN